MGRSIQSSTLFAILWTCWWTVSVTSADEGTELSPDEVCFLQSGGKGESTVRAGAVKKGRQAKRKAQQKQSPVPGSFAPGQVALGVDDVAAFVPDIGTFCFQGPDIDSGAVVAAFRAGPLNTFTSRSPFHHGTACADLGFPLLAISNDACWPLFSIHVRRNDNNVNATLEEARVQNVATIEAYAASRNVSTDFVSSWAACAATHTASCSDTPTPPGALLWWGASRTYTAEECAGIMNSVVPTLAAATPDVGSFTTAWDGICWEGPHDYLVDILGRISQVPAVADALFAGVTVQHGGCAARGFETVRDHRDECWMGAAKMMRTATEDADMGQWVAGPPGVCLRNSLLAYDAEHGLPEMTTLELYSCFVCEAGGAVRDRGLFITNDGSQYLGRLTPQYCATITAGLR